MNGSTTVGKTRTTRQSHQISQNQNSTSETFTTGNQNKIIRKEKEVETEAVTTNTSMADNMEVEGWDEEFSWTDEVETMFFKSLIKYKPLGVNKHFNMLLASHDFQNALGRDVDVNVLWKHVREMYCIEELENLEKTNTDKEIVDFCLPNSEFGTIMKEAKERHERSDKDTRLSASTPPSTPSKKNQKMSSTKAGKKSVVKTGNV